MLIFFVLWGSPEDGHFFFKILQAKCVVTTNCFWTMSSLKLTSLRKVTLRDVKVYEVFSEMR